MIKIPLTQGHTAIVDDEDFWVGYKKWFADVRDGQIYASSNRPKAKGKHIGLIRLHQVIMLPPEGMEVDHINGDTLDNRRCNLRLVTKSQNQRNKGKCRTNTSGFKGVTPDGNGRWRFQITVGPNRERIEHIGYATAELASLAYDCVAIAHFGVHARPNIISAPSVSP